MTAISVAPGARSDRGIITYVQRYQRRHGPNFYAYSAPLYYEPDYYWGPGYYYGPGFSLGPSF